MEARSWVRVSRMGGWSQSQRWALTSLIVGLSIGALLSILRTKSCAKGGKDGGKRGFCLVILSIALTSSTVFAE